MAIVNRALSYRLTNLIAVVALYRDSELSTSSSDVNDINASCSCCLLELSFL